MRKLFWTRFSLTLILLCSIAGCRSNTDSHDIRIGIIASLNGPAGEQGKNWLRGAELAALDAQKEGIPVKLVIEDDQTETKKVISAFSKLIESDHAQAVVGGTWDYLGEAAYPLAARYKVPFITPTNPVEVLSDSAIKSGYVFSNSMTLSSVKRALAAFIEKKQAKTLGIIYPNLPFGTEQAHLVKEIAEEHNLSVICDYEFPVEGLVSDLMKLASLKLKENTPDMTFGVLDYHHIDLLTKEFKTLSIRPTMVVTQHLDRAFSFSSDPGRYMNMYAVYPEVRSHAFDSKFTATYGETPKVYAAHGYDAVMFLAKTLSRGISPGQSAESFFYEGITGIHTLPSPSRSLVDSQAVIMTTKNGRFESDD